MRKRKTLRDRADTAAFRVIGDSIGFTSACEREAFASGYIAGHRANRISAAQRRVVQAAVKWRTCRLVNASSALSALYDAVEALQRAKGGR